MAEGPPWNSSRPSLTSFLVLETSDPSADTGVRHNICNFCSSPSSRSRSLLLEACPNSRGRNVGRLLSCRALCPAPPIPTRFWPLYILLDNVRRLPRPPDPPSSWHTCVPAVAAGKVEEWRVHPAGVGRGDQLEGSKHRKCRANEGRDFEVERRRRERTKGRDQQRDD